MDATKIIDSEVKEIFESANSLYAIIRAGKLAEYVRDELSTDSMAEFRAQIDRTSS